MWLQRGKRLCLRGQGLLPYLEQRHGSNGAAALSRLNSRASMVRRTDRSSDLSILVQSTGERDWVGHAVSWAAGKSHQSLPVAQRVAVQAFQVRL